MPGSKHQGQSARSPQDIVGGLALIAIAVLALYLVKDLPASSRVGFASGTAPRLFAYALIVLGAFVAITGWIKEGPSIDKPAIGTAILSAFVAAVSLVAFYLVKTALGTTAIAVILILLSLVALVALARIDGFPNDNRFALRGMIAILGSVLFFAFSIRVLGLALTGVPMVLLATAAAPGYRWKEAIVFAIGITIFCGLLFPFALGQPIPLWPTF
jgi:putative tricarboxylic transport membrane protein